MTDKISGILFRWVAAMIFFSGCFIYLLLFNGYHLVYREQTQLFLFSRDYLHAFLSKPGGLCSYAGTFLTQFFITPVAAAFLVSLQGILLFLVSGSILRRYKIYGLIWVTIPVILLMALESYQQYSSGNTFGFLVSVIFFSAYISVKSDSRRYCAGVAGSSLLYFIAGSFGLYTFVLCLFHEIFFAGKRGRLLIISIYVIMIFLIPFISARLFYYVKGEGIWLALFPLHLKKPLYLYFIAILLFYPATIAYSGIRNSIYFRSLEPVKRWKSVAIGIVMAAGLSFCVVRFVHDPKTEMLLKIDHFVQAGDWKKVVGYSFAYPGTNQLVTYYGNIAMYKSGQMGDYMFHLPQTGVHGLWLEWKRNEIAPFFGGELFYQLGYASEAYRWAFESMVAVGGNPRSLKRLAVTSIVTGDTSLARHYLDVLCETLFYSEWAQHYLKLLNNPALMANDKELAEKKHYNMHNDIFADVSSNDIGLQQLLNDNPDNRMAFEYYMAWRLLIKDIDGFAANIWRLRGLDYNRIPAHYEEAMLVYMNHTGRNITPDGYRISQSTIDRLSGYLRILSSCGNDRRKASRMLYKDYGGTYWYYLNYINLPGQ